MGRVNSGEAGSSRCTADIGGTVDVEMSPEDGCIQEGVGHSEQNHDRLS